MQVLASYKFYMGMVKTIRLARTYLAEHGVRNTNRFEICNPRVVL